MSNLPAGVKLSVHRPGELHAPKEAMVIRMSAETLDALQGNPQVKIAFDPNKPEIIIGGARFAMRPLKENSPHDLYLRAPSASKPMAPLKHYANITGKFTVERGFDDVQSGVRSATQQAKNSRQERTTVMLDAPPADVLMGGRGKGKATASSTRRPAARPSAPAPRAPSPLPPPNSATRTAVVKALSQRECTFDELLRLLPGGGEPSSRKSTLQGLLDQLAEKPNAARAPTLWRLKPSSWLEVRPWEWLDLPETTRTSIARTARLTFGNLNVADSDPVWQHVNFKSSGQSSKSADAPKRGVSSKEAKEKKMKPKADPKAEIMMRDETRPVPSSSRVTESSSMRRGPGSGYRKTGDDQPTSATRDPRRERAVEEKQQAPLRMKKRDPEADAESLKRKKPSHDGTEPPSAAKRRKTEPVQASPPKPETLPPIRKSDTTPNVRPSHKARPDGVAPARSSAPSRSVAPSISSSSRSAAPSVSSSASVSSRNHAESSKSRASNGVPKRRDRRSPIYTSSEDEGEAAPAPRKTLAQPANPAPRAAAPRPARPIPTDRKGLRATYKVTYSKYLSSYQRLFAQQSKIESLLNDYDDEDDVELLTPEETAKLKAEYARFHSELLNLQSMFDRSS